MATNYNSKNPTQHWLSVMKTVPWHSLQDLQVAWWDEDSAAQLEGCRVSSSTNETEIL